MAKKLIAVTALVLTMAALLVGGPAVYRMLAKVPPPVSARSNALKMAAVDSPQGVTKATFTKEDPVSTSTKPEPKVTLDSFLEHLTAANKGKSTLKAVTSSDIPADNGAHFFLVAAELLPEFDKDWLSERLDFINAHGWTDDPKLMALLASCQDAFDAVRAGVKLGNAMLPRCRGPEEPLPYAAKYKDLAKLMSIEAQMYAAQGDYTAAFDEFATIMEFANESGRGGVIINGLVGLSMEGYAADAAAYVLPNSNASAAEYRDYIARMESLQAKQIPIGQAAQNEAQDFGAWFNNAFQTEEQYRTSLLDPQVNYDEATRQWAAQASTQELRASMRDLVQSRVSILPSLQLPYYEAQALDWPAYAGSGLPPQSTNSSPQNLPRSEAHTDAVLHGTIVQAALETYRIEHGSYPASLEALSPAYVAQVPKDPFTGQSYRYSPDASDYALYSAGADMRDDGGTVNDYKAPGGDLVIHAP